MVIKSLLCGKQQSLRKESVIYGERKKWSTKLALGAMQRESAAKVAAAG
jgi:hypothetical protein